MYSIDTTKYLIHIHIEAEGVVERTDVVGAIFGQTEGLLGEDLDLRDLQRSGRVGRIDVQIASKHGKTSGELYIASSLDRAETAIFAAALETIERIGPCVSYLKVSAIEDLRAIKRRQIAARAKELLIESFDEVGLSTNEILAEVREASRVVKITSVGEEHLPAGPTVLESDAIIVLEGRADVLNLLRCGIKNTVAVEGTKVPQFVADLTRKKNTTVFVDGDRGGDLILSELLQVGDIDFVAFSPRGRSVEDMTRKEIIKSLRIKVPADVVRVRISENEAVCDIAQDVMAQAAEKDTGDSAESAAETAGEEKPEPEDAEDVLKKPVLQVETVPEIPAAPKLPEEEKPLVKTAVCEEDIRPVKPSNTALHRELTRKVPSNPVSLEEHVQCMFDTGKGRVLTEDFGIVSDYSLHELQEILPKLKSDADGIVVDAGVDQKFVDTALSKGIKYIAARSFDEMVRRPVGIRLITF
ncbi:MAG TPA: DNA primase DnaG [Methanocorpusculum sp.]|nr:DNA primase DnaG [Methanocorpusculum sp.]